MELTELNFLVKLANEADQQRDYKTAEALDQMIREAAGPQDFFRSLRQKQLFRKTPGGTPNPTNPFIELRPGARQLVLDGAMIEQAGKQWRQRLEDAAKTGRSNIALLRRRAGAAFQRFTEKAKTLQQDFSNYADILNNNLKKRLAGRKQKDLSSADQDNILNEAINDSGPNPHTTLQRIWEQTVEESVIYAKTKNPNADTQEIINIIQRDLGKTVTQTDIDKVTRRGYVPGQGELQPPLAPPTNTGKYKVERRPDPNSKTRKRPIFIPIPIWWSTENYDTVNYSNEKSDRAFRLPGQSATPAQLNEFREFFNKKISQGKIIPGKTTKKELYEMALYRINDAPTPADKNWANNFIQEYSAKSDAFRTKSGRGINLFPMEALGFEGIPIQRDPNLKIEKIRKPASSELRDQFVNLSIW